MSRIGRLPVEVPPQVKVAVDGRWMAVEGPKGKLKLELPRRTSATQKDGRIHVAAEGTDAGVKALHGLCRALIQNMVIGVQAGYTKKLEIHGVGFKAAVKGQEVNLTLGYSHAINYSLPEQVKVTVEENTKLTVEGPDKQAVGQVAADLRGFYPPEPYKGKGIRYVGEKVVRKEGKTVQ
jgi:large subunit ribosomal protein L6